MDKPLTLLKLGRQASSLQVNPVKGSARGSGNKRRRADVLSTAAPY
jgi:hypothetical protein